MLGSAGGKKEFGHVGGAGAIKRDDCAKHRVSACHLAAKWAVSAALKRRTPFESYPKP